MVAANLDAISPELVLVCPELRERALASPPDDMAWRSFVERARTTVRPIPAPPEPAESLTHAVVTRVQTWLVYALATVILTVGATLAMTVIADATARR
jgi:hypothetical protein